MNSSIITNIQGYSIHDGPGIRTVVFFKGCPMSCKWCANPECLSEKPQMGFISAFCSNCGKCRNICPNSAICSGDNEYRIDHSGCTVCGRCRDACSYGALVRYGDSMTVDEVWDAVRRDKMFYESSGGGVTVSGGEPLLAADFVRELFELCSMEKIDTCVETCGYVRPDAFFEIMPVTDHFLFDLKHMDPVVHKKYTGRDNDQILENAALVTEHGADVLFRQPLIPGVNDSETNIKATSEFLISLGENAVKLQLMPYHRMGQSKYKTLNIEFDLEGLNVMDNEKIEAVKNAYLRHGINCTISR